LFPRTHGQPYIYDAIRPIYRLYGKEEALQWHENRDPGDHNYQLDNRIAAYRFFSKQFGLQPAEGESPIDAEIKSYEELEVGLPQNNLTILDWRARLPHPIRSRPLRPIPGSAIAGPAQDGKISGRLSD